MSFFFLAHPVVIGRQFLGFEVSPPTFFGIGTNTPLKNVSGTTLYCTYRVNIRAKHLGRELSRLYNKCSAVIPSFEG